MSVYSANNFCFVEGDSLVVRPDLRYFDEFFRVGMKEFFRINCSKHKDKKIIIDLSLLSFIDSIKLGMFIEFVHLCNQYNHEYVSTGLNDSVLRIVEMTKLKEFLHVVDFSDCSMQ